MAVKKTSKKTEETTTVEGLQEDAERDLQVLEEWNTTGDWRDPDFKPADDDQGLEARMWRIAQQQQGKGV